MSNIDNNFQYRSDVSSESSEKKRVVVLEEQKTRPDSYQITDTEKKISSVYGNRSLDGVESSRRDLIGRVQ